MPLVEGVLNCDGCCQVSLILLQRPLCPLVRDPKIQALQGSGGFAVGDVKVLPWSMLE